MNGNAWCARTDIKCKMCGAATFYCGPIDEATERWKDKHYKDGKVVCEGRYPAHVRNEVAAIVALGQPEADSNEERRRTVDAARRLVAAEGVVGSIVSRLVRCVEGDSMPNEPIGGTAELRNGNGEVVAIIDGATGLVRVNPSDVPSVHGQNPTTRGIGWRAETRRRAAEFADRYHEPVTRFPVYNPTAAPYLRPVLEAYQREADNALSNSDFEQLPEGDRPSSAFIDFMNDLLREVSMCEEHTRRVLASQDMQHALAGLPRQSR